jgi:rhodanese-related sulfurtransferase
MVPIRGRLLPVDCCPSIIGGIALAWHLVLALEPVQDAHNARHLPTWNFAASVEQGRRTGMAHQHAPRFLQLVNDARSRIHETTVDDVKAKLDRGDRFHLIDVREESEYARNHLPGAIPLGKGILERDIEQRIPDTSAPLVLYCGGGFRSALAADNLQKMGYTNVLSMDGGIRGWREKGYPLTSG